MCAKTSLGRSPTRRLGSEVEALGERLARENSGHTSVFTQTRTNQCSGAPCVWRRKRTWCRSGRVVVRRDSGTTQGLVAKARLGKQRLTIPRLELVEGHMAVNSVANIRRVLDGFPLTSVHCWLDSSVARHWLRGNGEYRQFVANRVKKIKEHEIDDWRHVPTDQNPADLGSRGRSVTDAEL